MVRTRHHADDADRLGLHIDGSAAVAVVCRRVGLDVAVSTRSAAPIPPGSVRDGLIIDHQGVVAALQQLELPPVPAVVSIAAVRRHRVADVGISDGALDRGLAVRAWVGRGLVERVVPLDAVCQVRDAVAVAGLRTRGWVATDLVTAVDPRPMVDTGELTIDAADVPALGAALWNDVESWPVTLPVPPPGAWTVDHLG